MLNLAVYYLMVTWLSALSSTEATEMTCVSGYREIKGECWRAYVDDFTAEQAEKRCQEAGAEYHLLQAHTRRTIILFGLDILKQLTKEKPETIWLGIKCKDKVCLWRDGSRARLSVARPKSTTRDQGDCVALSAPRYRIGSFMSCHSKGHSSVCRGPKVDPSAGSSSCTREKTFVVENPMLEHPLEVADFGFCRSECKKRVGCSASTFDSEEKSCILVRSFGEEDVYLSARTTLWDKACSSRAWKRKFRPPVANDGKGCQARNSDVTSVTFYEHESVETIEDCVHHCQYDSKCTYARYAEKTKACWLSGAKSGKTKVAQRVVVWDKFCVTVEANPKIAQNSGNVKVDRKADGSCVIEGAFSSTLVTGAWKLRCGRITGYDKCASCCRKKKACKAMTYDTKRDQCVYVKKLTKKGTFLAKGMILFVKVCSSDAWIQGIGKPDPVPKNGKGCVINGRTELQRVSYYSLTAKNRDACLSACLEDPKCRTAWFNGNGGRLCSHMGHSPRNVRDGMNGYLLDKYCVSKPGRRG